jgi:hypothetical protein
MGFIIENKTSKYTNILTEEKQKSSEKELHYKSINTINTEDLDSIISKITPKNQHDAIDFSVVMGKELL